jgi:hypothetical protein
MDDQLEINGCLNLCNSTIFMSIEQWTREPSSHFIVKHIQDKKLLQYVSGIVQN